MAETQPQLQHQPKNADNSPFFGKETLFMSSKSLPDFIDGLVFGLMWVPAPSVMPCEKVGNSKMSAC